MDCVIFRRIDDYFEGSPVKAIVGDVDGNIAIIYANQEAIRNKSGLEVLVVTGINHVTIPIMRKLEVKPIDELTEDELNPYIAPTLVTKDYILGEYVIDNWVIRCTYDAEYKLWIVGDSYKFDPWNG